MKALLLALLITPVAAEVVNQPQAIVYTGPVFCTKDGKCAVILEGPSGTVLIPIPVLSECAGEVRT